MTATSSGSRTRPSARSAAPRVSGVSRVPREDATQPRARRGRCTKRLRSHVEELLRPPKPPRAIAQARSTASSRNGGVRLGDVSCASAKARAARGCCRPPAIALRLSSGSTRSGSRRSRHVGPRAPRALERGETRPPCAVLEQRGRASRSRARATRHRRGRPYRAPRRRGDHDVDVDVLRRPARARVIPAERRRSREAPRPRACAHRHRGRPSASIAPGTASGPIAISASTAALRRPMFSCSASARATANTTAVRGSTRAAIARRFLAHAPVVVAERDEQQLARLRRRQRRDVLGGAPAHLGFGVSRGGARTAARSLALRSWRSPSGSDARRTEHRLRPRRRTRVRRGRTRGASPASSRPSIPRAASPSPSGGAGRSSPSARPKTSGHRVDDEGRVRARRLARHRPRRRATSSTTHFVFREARHRRETEPLAQIDHGDDLAAIVGHALHRRRRAREVDARGSGLTISRTTSIRTAYMTSPTRKPDEVFRRVVTVAGHPAAGSVTPRRAARGRGA